MNRVVLIHWQAEDAARRAQQLRRDGQRVEASSIDERRPGSGLPAAAGPGYRIIRQPLGRQLPTTMQSSMSVSPDAG